MILVCGEALVDLFLGEAEGARLPAVAVAGGSPFNVAVALARLGVATGFLGGISTDAFGTMLADVLAREGVDGRHLLRSARPTTISVVATGPGGEPVYDFRGAGAADRAITRADLPATLPAAVRALAFGSYSLVVEPVGSALAGLAEREAGERLVSVDVNLRPTVEPEIGRWRDALARIGRVASIVKASEEDVAGLFGPGTALADAARAWLDRGAGLVVITRGAAGASAWTRGGEVSVAARPTSVVDTVGAGDSFHAALLAGLLREGLLTRAGVAGLAPDTLARLLAEAAAAAAITVSRRGADTPRALELAQALA